MNDYVYEYIYIAYLIFTACTTYMSTYLLTS